MSSSGFEFPDWDPIWDPTDDDFWTVKNYALWIYAVGILVVLGGAAAVLLLLASK